ncbi:hypothetical protein Tco_0157511 [Tanacetum coccineum]
MTASSLKPLMAYEVSLTSYMLKVANISEQPEKSLILPLEEVNADTSTDKSLCRTVVQHGAQPKATTDKSSKKKRNPPSSILRTSKPVRESSLLKQVTDTQPTEETVSTVDATLSLDASESAEEQGN